MLCQCLHNDLKQMISFSNKNRTTDVSKYDIYFHSKYKFQNKFETDFSDWFECFKSNEVSTGKIPAVYKWKLIQYILNFIPLCKMNLNLTSKLPYEISEKLGSPL